MDERYPLQVRNNTGEPIGRVKDLDTASVLLALAGVNSTLWLGCDAPQKIYTATGEETEEGYSGIVPFVFAGEQVSDGLMITWDEWKSIYEVEGKKMGEEWWTDFRDFVWGNYEAMFGEDADLGTYSVEEFISRKAFMTDEEFLTLEPHASIYRDAIRRMGLPPVMSIPDEKGDEQD